MFVIRYSTKRTIAANTSKSYCRTRWFNSTQDISTVTCHKCKQKGCYTNNCPSKTQFNSPLSAMFVGVCSINSPSDANGSGLDNFFNNWCPDFGNTDKYSNQDKDDLLNLPNGFLRNEENKIEDEAIYMSTYKNETVMSGLVSHRDKEWLLDLGATCGVTYKRNGVTNMKTSDCHITIRKGNQIPTLGQRTVTLRSECGTTINVPDVYYAPDFAKNILSLQTLLDNDWTFSGATKQALALSPGNGKVDFKTNSQDNHFYLRQNELEPRNLR